MLVDKRENCTVENNELRRNNKNNKKVGSFRFLFVNETLTLIVLFAHKLAKYIQS